MFYYLQVQYRVLYVHILLFGTVPYQENPLHISGQAFHTCGKYILSLPEAPINQIYLASVAVTPPAASFKINHGQKQLWERILIAFFYIATRLRTTVITDEHANQHQSHLGCFSCQGDFFNLQLICQQSV